MKDDIMMGDTPKAAQRRRKLRDAKARGRLWKHSTLRDIDGLISPDEIAQMFCFTLVRNPWDRVVSYYHWLRTQSFAHPSVQMARDNDFDAFLRLEPIQHSLRSTPAAIYMRDANGQERCDAYIRIEHFAKDAASLEEHLGFEITLGHENRSDRHPDFRSYYTTELAEIVSDLCARDIARFNYRFDG